MKIPYSSVVLRYVHDLTTGEFVNIGVVVFAPEQRFLGARFATSLQRVSAMFHGAELAYVKRIVKHLDARLTSISDQLKNELPLTDFDSIEDLVRSVLPIDDSALQWSETMSGITADPSIALNSVFNSMVERYAHSNNAKSAREQETAKAFKSYLKDHAAALTHKVIESPNYQHEFVQVWKNSIYHCYEPVSFDLESESAITEKASRWLGRGHSLIGNEEQYKIYFLVVQPADEEKMTAFENACNLLQMYPTEHAIIKEDELESFAKVVLQEMINHDAEAGR